jgi:hypothetical protein
MTTPDPPHPATESDHSPESKREDGVFILEDPVVREQVATILRRGIARAEAAGDFSPSDSATEGRPGPRQTGSRTG